MVVPALGVVLLLGFGIVGNSALGIVADAEETVDDTLDITATATPSNSDEDDSLL